MVLQRYYNLELVGGAAVQEKSTSACQIERLHMDGERIWIVYLNESVI